MKSVFVSIAVLVFATPAAAVMSRVVSVESSNTIVVEAKGARTTVVLRDVAVATEDLAAATAYLRRALVNAWVYIEDGQVYRSPDGLHVNDALRRRAWTGATDFGALYERRTAGPTVVVISATAGKAGAPELQKSPAAKKRRSKRR
ncbi:MAG TPA: hypothetical protein VF057_11520 [Thermoanaerobaculia bacterium]